MTNETKCETCDGTKAVARDGGFDACPTCQEATDAAMHASLVEVIRRTSRLRIPEIATAIMAEFNVSPRVQP